MLRRLVRRKPAGHPRPAGLRLQQERAGQEDGRHPRGRLQVRERPRRSVTSVGGAKRSTQGQKVLNVVSVTLSEGWTFPLYCFLCNLSEINDGFDLEAL